MAICKRRSRNRTDYSAASHGQEPTSYSQYGGYAPPSQPPPQPSYPPQSSYSSPSYPPPQQPYSPPRVASPPGGPYSPYAPAAAPQPFAAPQAERQYSLGGGGYGGSSVPALANPHDAFDERVPYAGAARTPGPIDTAVGVAGGAGRARSPTSPRGPRGQTQAFAAQAQAQRPGQQSYDDSPPGYDGPGQWSAPSGKS